MIARGDCSLFVGPPGSGKSWITMEFGVAGASQRPIFGIFQSRPLKVLIVDEENPVDGQHRRLRALVKAWGLEGPELLGRLYLAQPCQGFTFRDAEYVRSLHRLVEEIHPDLIVLDSMTAISTIRNENDAVEVRQFFHDCLYPLRSICGSTVLCIHHTSKAAYQYDEQVEEVGMARGSIDYIAASDSALILRPVQRGGSTLRLAPIKTRRGRIPDPIILEIVDGTEGGARPLARTPPKTNKTADTKSQRARQILLQFLEDSPGEPVPGEALREWTQMVDATLSPSDIRYALSTLGAEGRLQITKGGEDGRESLYLLKPKPPTASKG
ncbi:MAG: AAA family ATPase [Gemmatimonadales bacterium]|nr:MAG: AAA family ATPase [Gemmatimonadales bacterium]